MGLMPISISARTSSHHPTRSSSRMVPCEAERFIKPPLFPLGKIKGTTPWFKTRRTWAGAWTRSIIMLKIPSAAGTKAQEWIQPSFLFSFSSFSVPPYLKRASRGGEKKSWKKPEGWKEKTIFFLVPSLGLKQATKYPTPHAAEAAEARI